jgi:hypothetical protein
MAFAAFFEAFGLSEAYINLKLPTIEVYFGQTYVLTASECGWASLLS